MSDPMNYDAELRLHNEVLRLACDIRRHDRVLDIGCGAGQTTRDAARIAAAGSAVGVDISAAMIARAQVLTDAEGLRNVRFEQADAQVHRFPSEHFDVVISRFGTMFFADPIAAFSNIRQALRSEGRLVMMVWQDHEATSGQFRFSRALRGAIDADKFPGGPDPFSLADPTTVEGILSAAGFAETAFTDVREPVYYGKDVAAALDWVRGFSYTRPCCSDSMRLPPRVRSRDYATLLPRTTGGRACGSTRAHGSSPAASADLARVRFTGRLAEADSQLFSSPPRLANWKPGTLRIRAARRGAESTQARRCPERPHGAHSGGGHGVPHGPAARVPRGEREVRSERSGGVSWDVPIARSDISDLNTSCVCIRPRPTRGMQMSKHRIFAIKFAKVYPLYVQKAERKDRTRAEVDRIICWLTGYSQAGLRKQIKQENDLETFFAQAPAVHPNSSRIKGVVCGVRVEDIEDPLMQKIRYLDKLIDELAKGKEMEKILRQSVG